MPLTAEETTKVSELAAATVLSDTDLLLVTRTGANVKAALSLLLAYINENIDLSVYATLASPALTGTPSGPTATPGTNTTQLATTAFVEAVRVALAWSISSLSSVVDGKATPLDISTAIAALVDSSPATLNTLNELAAALGGDPSFATTVATAMGYRLRFDAAQTLSAEQKTQGLANLGAEIAGAAAAAQAAAVQRGNHTGTQAASTISDFAAAAKMAVIAAVSGLLKADGSGNVSAAVAGTDYATPGQVLRVLANPSAITRGQKFGNHSYIGNSTPVDGPYKGSTSGSTPLASIALVEALTNRGNISDCALWEMNSNVISTATEVSLYALAGSTIYPQQQWRTGAKMQFLASLALSNVVPTSENFVYRIGLANGSNSDHRAADPWAGTASGTGNEHTGCAALIFADNTSPYYQCKSGRKTSVETTVTDVPYVVGKFEVYHILVTATGAVEFRINGDMVATHSGTGIIPDGAYLNEGVAVRNIAVTTTAKKGFYLDEFAFRLDLPGERTGFAFA